jgi:hypothetical protein
MNGPDWVVLREYATQVEADVDAGILEGSGLPFQVQGPPIGIFGPGFAGATAAGVRLLVPRDRVEEAELLLGEPGGLDPFE